MKLSTHILFSVLALGTMPLFAETPVSEDNYSAVQDILYDAIDKYEISSGSQEEERYFYHSDHLGSANWITKTTQIERAIEQDKQNRNEQNPIYYENIVREEKGFPQRGYNYSAGD